MKRIGVLHTVNATLWAIMTIGTVLDKEPVAWYWYAAACFIIFLDSLGGVLGAILNE